MVQGGSKRLTNTSLECDWSVHTKGPLALEDESNTEEVDETDRPERTVRLAGASHRISTGEEEVSPEERGDTGEAEADTQEEIDNGAVDGESVDHRGVEQEKHPGAGLMLRRGARINPCVGF
jgi:hypothetical protein